MNEGRENHAYLRQNQRQKADNADSPGERAQDPSQKRYFGLLAKQWHKKYRFLIKNNEMTVFNRV